MSVFELPSVSQKSKKGSPKAPRLHETIREDVHGVINDGEVEERAGFTKSVPPDEHAVREAKNLIGRAKGIELPEVTEIDMETFDAALAEYAKSWTDPSVQSQQAVPADRVDPFAPDAAVMAKADRLMANDARQLRMAKDMLRDFIRQEKELKILSTEIEAKLTDLDARRLVLEREKALQTEEGANLLADIATLQEQQMSVHAKILSKQKLIADSKTAFQQKFDMSFDQITNNL